MDLTLRGLRIKGIVENCADVKDIIVAVVITVVAVS